MVSTPTTRRAADETRTDPWLVTVKPNPRAGLRLFCFPYAGGGAYGFRPWGPELPASVEAFALQYPGRSERFGERPYTKLRPLIEAVAASLLPLLDRPFAFFGHSMGGLVAFELARKLRRERGLAPAHLFVSGCGGPKNRLDSRYSTLPEDELMEKLTRFEGAPREVLENVELMRLMLPTIRADFAACEDYLYAAETPLSCPIMALGGVDDHETSRARLEEWGAETTGHFSLQMFAGGHFFINTSQTQILQHVAHGLGQVARQIYA